MQLTISPFAFVPAEQKTSFVASKIQSTEKLTTTRTKNTRKHILIKLFQIYNYYDSFRDDIHPNSPSNPSTVWSIIVN